MEPTAEEEQQHLAATSNSTDSQENRPLAAGVITVTDENGRDSPEQDEQQEQ